MRPTFADLHCDFDTLILSSLKRNPTMSSITSQSEGMLTVSQWLQGMGLGQYESHFMNTGWDTIDRVVLMDEGDLHQIGITLAGHQKKIKTAIEIMKAFTMSSHHMISGEGSLGALPHYNTLPVTSSSLRDAPKFGTMT